MVYGRDAAAAFLNPATAVLVDDARLSFSVNFYTMSFVYAPRWYVPGPIDRSKFGNLQIDNTTMTDLEFNALPSSLCFFFRASDVGFLVRGQKSARMRDGRLGFCFATVQSQTFNYAAEGFDAVRGPSVTRQAQSLSQSYQRFAAGPTYAMNITNAFAIGASLHASLASHRSLLAASATTYGSTAVPLTSMFYAGSRGDSFQLEATVGATLRWGKQSVGISLKSPSVHVYGVGGANRQSHFDGSGSNTNVLSTSGSFVSRSPLRIGIGTGVEGAWGQFEVNTMYSTALGASYSAGLEGQEINSSNGQVTDQKVNLDLSERAKGVVNFSAGAELHMSPTIGLLTGFSTDISAVPQGALKGSLFNYYPYQTNRVTGSLGLGSHGPGGELMVGAELSVGFGDRLAVNSYQLPPVVGTTGQGTYQLMLVIAGSTSLRALKQAVEGVKEVVTNPSVQKPALPTAPNSAPTYNPKLHEDPRPKAAPPP